MLKSLRHAKIGKPVPKPDTTAVWQQFKKLLFD